MCKKVHKDICESQYDEINIHDYMNWYNPDDNDHKKPHHKHCNHHDKDFCEKCYSKKHKFHDDHHDHDDHHHHHDHHHDNKDIIYHEEDYMEGDIICDMPILPIMLELEEDEDENNHDNHHVNDILEKTKRHNSEIFRLMAMYGIPDPAAQKLVRQMIRLTLKYE